MSLADASTWRAFAREPVRGLQRSLRHSLEEAAREEWWASVPADLAAMAASSSGWGAGAALLRAPTERVLQLPDGDVRIAVCERLAVQVAGTGECTHVSRMGRVCGHLAWAHGDQCSVPVTKSGLAAVTSHQPPGS